MPIHRLSNRRTSMGALGALAALALLTCTGVAAQPARALRGDALDERALARGAIGLRARRGHSATRTSTFFRYSPSGNAASVG